MPSEDEIRAWWNNNPNAQIGIVTGAISNLVVVDVESGGSFDGYPATLTAKTGGGGRHFYFKHPGKEVSNGVRVRPLTDIRGDGGYVVVPPSCSEKGAYEWLVAPEDGSLADLPSWVLEEQERVPAGEGGVEQDWEAIFNGEVLKGMRNDTAAKVAGKLLQAMPPEAWPLGYEIFKTWNQQHVTPPLEARRLQSTWKSIEKAQKLSREKRKREKAKLPPRIRIAIIGTPTRPLTFEAWRSIIQANFPDLVQAAEAAVSIPVQFLIKDVTNPFALVLVDVPSSGKTITINFLDGMIEITYTTDKFSAASFVSNAANVSKEELADVDLLPRIKYRMLLVRDLAPLFAKRADDLTESLGTLTRVLDGEGLQTDSGTHGHRGYSGEYLFMILAASTPIQHHVWKVMGTLGSRLFFLGVHSRRKSEEELANQVVDKSYKEKERICREATRDFLYTLWNTHKEGIEWDKQADDKNVVALIARCAMMLARLRGVVNFWKDDFSDVERYEQPIIEQPDRITQLLYNFARGHALVCGRTSVADEDLRIILDMCFDSAPPGRTRLFRALIDHGGIMKTSEIEKELNCSKPTARKEMRTLEILSIVTQEEVSSGTSEFRMQLVDDLSWFLSDECRAIRGRPMVEPQAETDEAIKQF